MNNSTKICPTCNGTGRVKVETMNKQAIKTILKKGIKHWSHHGLHHLNEKTVVKKCFQTIMMYSDKALEELEKEEPEPPKYLCGDSARQVLRSHVGLALPINGPNFLYGYEDRIIENRRKGGVNYVRECIIDVERWRSLVINHTEKFISEGIRIEYTLADGNNHGYGDYKKAVQFLKPYVKYVICETENEFGDDSSKIDRAIEKGKYIDDEGLISSGGAWGNLHHAREDSEEFLSRYQPQIITMHRPYPPEQAFKDWIAYLKGFNKPIIENEFLMDDAAQIERYVRLGFDKGLYGFNNYLGDHLELMGKLAKEYNQ